MYATSNTLSLNFYTYPDMDLVTVSADFGINDQGDWQIFSINSDKSLVNVDAIVIIEGGNLYELLSKVSSIDYDKNTKKVIREFTFAGITIYRWEKVSENAWLWRF